MKGLVAIGIGTLLLPLWRFLSLPLWADALLWSVSIGSIAVGIGYAIAEAPAFNNRTRWVLVWAGATLAILGWASVNKEYLALNAGLCIILSALLVGRRWWYYAAAGIVLAFLTFGYFAAGAFGDAPWTWLLLAFAGLVLGQLPRNIAAGSALALGTFLLAIGSWRISQLPSQFVEAFDFFESFSITFALMHAAGLIVIGMLILVPSWRPLARIGQHCVSVYFVTMLAARAKSAFDTGGTLRDVLIPDRSARYSSSFLDMFTSATAAPSVVLAISAVVVCFLVACHKSWGPAEKPFVNLATHR
ncbi:hypothetical protein WG936_11065 [Corynebacterium sp. H127]|uniref:hypothetical protein n=1 Tax=Corynebacterium sp. H127 TaxID=3133418 RepID=UPI0030A27CF7